MPRSCGARAWFVSRMQQSDINVIPGTPFLVFYRLTTSENSLI